MGHAVHLNSPTSAASVLVMLMFFWTLFLMYDARTRTHAPSAIKCAGLILHNIPTFSLLATSIVAQTIDDTALVWFVLLLVFRYWRILVNIFFWFRYKPTLPTEQDMMTAADCTVIVPTVGPADNDVFADMIAAILVNGPACLVLSTNAENALQQMEAFLPIMVKQLATGTTPYQIEHGIGGIEIVTKVQLNNAHISNKRAQVVDAFEKVETDILIMADDTAIWHPHFLTATLPAFNDSGVGFVGTRKWVKYLLRTFDENLGFFQNIWQQYCMAFWNCMGGLYLIRHNFEIRATNAADGGVFCVSGRSSLIRSEIVNNEAFKFAFLNEYVCRLGDWFPGWGPVTADDDNFITRLVINQGWKIKIQYSKEATMTTVLGKYPLKFPDQCKRWSRTTFRQNPIALASDRTIWWAWPLTVWTTYLPWLYNAALIWDGLAVYTLTQTKLYRQSGKHFAMMVTLVLFIWASKLVKTIPWFIAHPKDFIMFFLIPAYPLFAYYHSLLKIYTAFTFWDLAWSGRKLPKAE